ncbi:hypothetical protein [Cephaloticoccus capnophilus]|uniref:hypothetical protein n=1 Tax=Cephaloticoccus capnophilus TaxID=1548208 RepID=UPI000837B006|nr:hypothetical protein [Cephaloticoccus capnophilus]
MRVIEVRLSLEVVVPLLEVVTEAAELLCEEPSSAVHLASLPDDLREVWRADLVGSQKSDIHQLLGLFGEKFFEEGLVYLDEQNAEPVLRACAAVRLQLHRRQLHGLSEDELESGEIEVANLTEPLRRAFVAYLFLATLQELILSHLNPIGE